MRSRAKSRTRPSSPPLKSQFPTNRNFTKADLGGLNLGFRCARQDEKEKVIKFYDFVIEVNNVSEYNLRWKKDVHPSHQLLNTSVDNNELFIYEEDGEILGALVMNKSYNESYDKVTWGTDSKDVGIIHVLATRPDCFGKGVATKLLSGLKNHAKETGLKAVRLDVFKINTPAINLYNKMGFVFRKEMVMTVPRIGDENFELYEYMVGD